MCQRCWRWELTERLYAAWRCRGRVRRRQRYIKRLTLVKAWASSTTMKRWALFCCCWDSSSVELVRMLAPALKPCQTIYVSTAAEAQVERLELLLHIQQPDLTRHVLTLVLQFKMWVERGKEDEARAEKAKLSAPPPSVGTMSAASSSTSLNTAAADAAAAGIPPVPGGSAWTRCVCNTWPCSMQ